MKISLFSSCFLIKFNDILQLHLFYIFVGYVALYKCITIKIIPLHLFCVTIIVNCFHRNKIYSDAREVLRPVFSGLIGPAFVPSCFFRGSRDFRAEFDSYFNCGFLIHRSRKLHCCFLRHFLFRGRLTTKTT